MIKVAIMATAYRSITRPFSAPLQDALSEMIAHSINEKSNFVISQIGEGDFQAGLRLVNGTLGALGMQDLSWIQNWAQTGLIGVESWQAGMSAEALLATALGLLAAIPAVIAYNRYSNQVERLEMRYDNFVEEFSSILQRQAHALVGG